MKTRIDVHRSFPSRRWHWKLIELELNGAESELHEGSSWSRGAAIRTAKRSARTIARDRCQEEKFSKQSFSEAHEVPE